MKLSLGPVKSKDLLVALAMAEVVCEVASERAIRVAATIRDRQAKEVKPCAR